MIYTSMLQIENFDIDFTRCIRIKVEDRIRIEKDIRVLRFKDKFINKIETFFIDDIVFENDMQQSELDVRDFCRYNELDVILFRYQHYY